MYNVYKYVYGVNILCSPRTNFIGILENSSQRHRFQKYRCSRTMKTYLILINDSQYYEAIAQRHML